MKKISLKKLIPFFFMLTLAIGLGLQGPVSHAEDYEQITSLEDFYKKEAEQILEHKTVKYYKLSSEKLQKEIWGRDTSFFDHYDPSSPLTSGCYLGRYSDGGNIHWDGSTLKLTLNYPYSKEDMDAHFATMKSLAAQLKCDDNYETVKKVHDYLCNHFEYDHRDQYTNYTDIEGFRDGRMVCQGYALATYYILNSCGIPTRIITGYGGTGTGDTNHAWNLVNLNNKWYNLDVTWDDTDSSKIRYTYFLKSDADFPEHTRLGVYAESHFTDMISTKSYPSPSSFARGRNLVYLVFFSVIVILLSIKVTHKKKEPKEKAGVILVDDYDGLVFETPEDDQTTDVLASHTSIETSDETTEVLSAGDQSPDDSTTDVLFSITRDEESY